MTTATPVTETRHVPVLCSEIVELLQASKGGDFLDCTLGGGGHAEAILSAHPESTVTGCDRDKRAIERTSARLARFGERFKAFHTPFSSFNDVVKGRTFDGVLADLGLSTDQLFEERGFSFHDDAPLDMRMNEEDPLTAQDIVNTYSFNELLRVFRQGGAEQEAHPMAKAIADNRPISSAKALGELAKTALAFKNHKKTGKKSHPATVVFQALRIEVNKEVSEIQDLLRKIPNFVKPAGRLAVISFHSLEDTIVTRVMRGWEGGDRPPARWGNVINLPECRGKLLTKKAVMPAEKEVAENPASRSARVRVFEFKSL